MSSSYGELFDSSVVLEKDSWTPDILANIPTCKGVLLFTDSNRHPIQLLQAGNVRRTTRTKLFAQDEGTSKKSNISNLAYHVFWRCYYNDFMTQTAYVYLADALFGKHADEWIQLPRPCFSCIEMDSYLPYFDISRNPTTSDTRIVFGLFANRKLAVKFSNILNTVFGLCRNPKLLKTGRESSCSYFQMKTCPAPCLQPAQIEGYLQRCKKAIDNASGNIKSSLSGLRQDMEKAASNMDFEKASILKKQMEQLEKLHKPDYGWVHDLKNLAILHVDRSSKISIDGQRKQVQQYQWFKIDSETIYDLGACSPESQEDVDALLEKNWTSGSKVPFPESIEKHLGNLTFFLYRSKKSGMWLDCTHGISGDRLYPKIESLVGKELPMHRAEKKDTK